MKEGKCTGKNKNLMEPGNRNEIKRMKKDVDLDLQEGGDRY